MAHLPLVGEKGRKSGERGEEATYGVVTVLLQVTGMQVGTLTLSSPSTVLIHQHFGDRHFSSPSEAPLWLLNPQELGVSGQERKRDVPNCSMDLFLENHGPQMVAEMPGK